MQDDVSYSIARFREELQQMQNSMANRLGVLVMLCATAAPVFAWQSKSAPDTRPNGKHKRGADDADAKPKKEDKAEKTVYDYNLAGADGKDLPLASFKGKVILLVNLARNSSYNDQLQGLIKVSEKYKDKGLVVIGVPSNDFGAAEPGTDAEIQKIYKMDDKVPFVVTAKSTLIGDNALPFYMFLTKSKGESAGGGERGGGGGERGAGPAAAGAGGSVHWNYTKFLIDRSGKVTRFEPDVAPDSPEMLSTLDEMFGGGGGGGRSRAKPDQTAKNADGGDKTDAN
jgi:glutathione peroxidase